MGRLVEMAAMRAEPGHPLLKAGVLAVFLVASSSLLLPTASVQGAHEPLQGVQPLHVAQSPIIAFGDSYTSGWGTSPGHDYPTHLALMFDRPIINAGWPGDTAADGMARMERDVLDRDPEIVLIAFGANDALQGLDVNDTVATIEQMVATMRSRNIDVVLLGVRQAAYQDDFEGALLELAQRHGALFVPDILREVHADPGLRADAIHPNDAGALLVAQRVAPALQTALDAH